MHADHARAAAVAGLFYPEQPERLRAELDALLQQAGRRPQGASGPIKALLVPHAGYIYSGRTAAAAYAALRDQATRIRRVVLLGPAHRWPLHGLALPGCSSFATPLGEVAIDRALVERLRGLPQVIELPAAHAQEHALEVQLPFLQHLLGAFTLLPLVVGEASVDQVAEVIEAVWGGEETLLLISSDLSHYLSHAQAQRIDRSTIEQVLRLDHRLDHQQACGATPLNGLLRCAGRHRLRPQLLAMCNSGDGVGDRARVVGYAAVAFSAEASAASDDDLANDHQRPDPALGAALLSQARSAIAAQWQLPVRRQDHARLDHPGACFVTLHRQRRLRGCVGNLEARGPLREVLAHNARAAAFSDHRFAPLARREYDDLAIEVSLLTPLRPWPLESQAALLDGLAVGVDGLVLDYRGRRATFLPQVWDSLPEPEDFVAELKHKAGLPADFWSPELQVFRYRVQQWHEPSGRPS